MGKKQILRTHPDSDQVHALSDGLSVLKIKEEATTTNNTLKGTNTVTTSTTADVISLLSESLTRELDFLSITSTTSPISPSPSFASLPISDDFIQGLWQQVYDAWSLDNKIVNMDGYNGMGKGFGGGAGGCVYEYTLSLQQLSQLKLDQSKRKCVVKRQSYMNNPKPELLEQLLKEARFYHSLSHRSVSSCYGVGVSLETQHLYLILPRWEWKLNGLTRSMRQKCVRVIFRSVVEGVKYLHSKNILHRDINGANIMGCGNRNASKITPSSLHVVLIDLGAASSTEIAVRGVCGTPPHIAPEVMAKQPCGPASDIWQIGITLLNFIGLVPPDPHKNHRDLELKISDVEESLYPDAQAFLTLCLQRDPNNRASCDDLLKHPFVQV